MYTYICTCCVYSCMTIIIMYIISIRISLIITACYDSCVYSCTCFVFMYAYVLSWDIYCRLHVLD